MDHGLRSTGEKKRLRHQVYPTRAGSRKGLISRFRAFAMCSVGPSTSATIGNTQRFSGGVFQCRAIVPNSSARRASGGVLPSSAVSPHRSSHLLGPNDWGQSIYHKRSLQKRIHNTTISYSINKARMAIPINKLTSSETSLFWIRRDVLLHISELFRTPDNMIKRFRLP